MVNTFRLYGPAVGVSDTVVDADVTGVSVDGSVELTPQSGDYQQFTLDPARLRELVSEDLAYDLSKIDEKDPIWKAIEDVTKRADEAPDDEQTFTDAIKTLFTGA